MNLNDSEIRLRDLLAFDFYPTSGPQAHARFRVLLDLYRKAEPDVDPTNDPFEPEAALRGEDEAFVLAAKLEGVFFLTLALRWAQACHNALGNWQKFETAISQIRFELFFVVMSHDYEVGFQEPILEAWALHMNDAPWQRLTFRKWAADGQEDQDLDDDVDLDFSKSVEVFPSFEASLSGDLKVVVAKTIGDADSSAGRDLKKRYGSSIGEPLPIRPITGDYATIAEKLTSRFPWADTAVQAILGEIAVNLAYGDPRRSGLFGPLLLVGPPGCGKTHLLTYTANLLGLPQQTLAVGGSGDSSGLLPVARGWSTTKPSGPFDAMHSAGCANPIVILDELEKASTIEDTRNGNVHGTLLSMLNGTGQYYDTCLLTNTDLSHVTFWATANDLSALRGPLADRFQVVQMKGPRGQDFDVILNNVIEDSLRAFHLTADAVPEFPVLNWQKMRAEFVRSNGSIRQMQQAYRAWLQSRAASLIGHCEKNCSSVVQSQHYIQTK